MTSGSLRKDALELIAEPIAVNPLLIHSLVKDVMNHEYCHFDEEMTLAQALVILLQEQLSGAPVLDARGVLRGFLSLKDCLPFAHLLGAKGHGEDANLSVGHLMSYETHFLTPDMSLEEALQAFLNQWFHVYPVVDDSKHVVGVISRHRLLSFLSR